MFRGSKPVVRLSVAVRQKGKHVTTVTHAQSLGIDLEQLSATLAKACAASSMVTETPDKSLGKVVCVQGALTDVIEKVLVEDLGVPRKSIVKEGALKKKKKT